MVRSKRPVIALKSGCSCSMPGVWQAVAHNEGAAVVFHSPKACAHVSQEMSLGIYYRSITRQEFVAGRYLAPLISSELNDEHSVFGGAEQLRDCINFVARQYQPRYIVVAGSCVAGVIGDDIAEVAAAVEQEIAIPVIAVPCSGYLDGEYHAGFYYAAMAVAERFMTPRPAVPGQVTILGDCGGPDSQDCREIKSILERFGLIVHTQFPGGACQQDIEQAAASSLNILLGRSQSFAWIRKLATGLQERCGIPFFDSPHPVGWLETKEWLTELGTLLGRPEAAEQAIAAERQRLQAAVQEVRPNLQSVKMVLVIGRPLMYFEPEWVMEWLSLAEIEPATIILLRGLTNTQQAELRQVLKTHTQAPVVEQDEADEMMAEAELILTTHELTNDQQRQFFLPLLLPIGVGGLIRQLRRLERLALRPALRGGILYG